MIREECDWLKNVPDCNTTKSQTIRSLDGSCNNVEVPNMGRAFTPFERLVEALPALRPRKLEGLLKDFKGILKAL